MSQGAGMPCPVCSVALVMSDRQGVEIDYCPQCRGVWLDRGELDKIIERSTAEYTPAPRSPSSYPHHRCLVELPLLDARMPDRGHAGAVVDVVSLQARQVEASGESQAAT